MKTLLVLLVFAACAFGENADPATARAIEGAKILHSSMRDPDSFKIGRVWITMPVGHARSIAHDLARSLSLSILQASPIQCPIPCAARPIASRRLDTAFSRDTRVLFRPKFKLFFAPF